MRRAWLLVLMLLFVAAALAKQDVQVNDFAANELRVIYPSLETYHVRDTTKFNFLVVNGSAATYNASEGMVSCHYGVQNDNNSVIIYGDAVASLDYFQAVIFTNYTGPFQYCIWCNSSKQEHGYACGAYDVSLTGVEEQVESRTLLALIMLVPLVLAIFLLIGSATLSQEHNLVRMFLFLLSPAFFLTSMHFGALSLVKFYDFPELQDAIGSTVYWVGIVWSVLITYFIIYAIYKMVKSAAKRKQEEMEY